MASKLRQIQYVPNPKRLPSPQGPQIVDIRPGSAMAVLGVFVEVVRSRFTADNALPWSWDKDPKKSTMEIETAFNEDNEQKNKRPAIYIDREEQTRGRTVIGDFVGQKAKTGLRAFWALDTLPILIECVASKKVESSIVADLTAVFLHASSDLIQAKFGFHEMTPVNTGRTQPFERDKTQWVTPVTFNVQFPLRWTNMPIATMLNQISMAASVEGADDYFERIAVGPWRDKTG